MWSILVVILQPFLGSLLGFRRCIEEIGIKYFFPKTFVEPLKKCILIGFTRLDEPQGNVVFFSLIGEGLGG